MFCQQNSKQATCRRDMQFPHVFKEVFQRIQGIWTFLYLIKNEKCLIRNDFLPSHQLQIGDNAIRGLVHEKLPYLLVFIKVADDSVFEIPLAEFLENPCLAHLTCPAQYQRLAVFAFLPGNQFLFNVPFHKKPCHFWPFSLFPIN